VSRAVGQGATPWLRRQLAALMAHQGHALLLTGPAGLGQFALALGLAQTWLCDQPSPDGACGHCEGCHGFDVKTHPDLRVLLPETLALDTGWPLDDKTMGRLERQAAKPSRWIKVEAAREAVAFTQQTRSRGRTKVVLVFPTERLNTEASNTLLKTLEEPPGQVRFVLATEAGDALLPTLRSRCQTHTMAWPEPAEALAWLQSQQPGWGADAGTWLRAAGGRPEEALVWADLVGSPRTWHGLPAALAQGDWTALKDWPVDKHMDLLQKLCHDLMALAVGGAPRYFDAHDLPKGPLDMRRLVAWSVDLRTAAKTMEHPYSPGLMQEAWAERARTALAVH
jgi:DNA polymerase-3 subunit delta'